VNTDYAKENYLTTKLRRCDGMEQSWCSISQYHARSLWTVMRKWPNPHWITPWRWPATWCAKCYITNDKIHTHFHVTVLETFFFTNFYRNNERLMFSSKLFCWRFLENEWTAKLPLTEEKVGVTGIGVGLWTIYVFNSSHRRPTFSCIWVTHSWKCIGRSTNG
jgi:hypothetical protein